MIIKIDEILDSEIIRATKIDKFLVYGFTHFLFFGCMFYKHKLLYSLSKF